MTAIPQEPMESIMAARQAVLWKEHHETLDWVVRKWRRFTSGIVRVTHDGERVLFIYEAAVDGRLREFIGEVDPFAFCTAPDEVIVFEVTRTLFKEAENARR